MLALGMRRPSRRQPAAPSHPTLCRSERTGQALAPSMPLGCRDDCDPRIAGADLASVGHGGVFAAGDTPAREGGRQKGIRSEPDAAGGPGAQPGGIARRRDPLCRTFRSAAPGSGTARRARQITSLWQSRIRAVRLPMRPIGTGRVPHAGLLGRAFPWPMPPPEEPASTRGADGRKA